MSYEHIDASHTLFGNLKGHTSWWSISINSHWQVRKILSPAWLKSILPFLCQLLLIDDIFLDVDKKIPPPISSLSYSGEPPLAICFHLTLLRNPHSSSSPPPSESVRRPLRGTHRHAETPDTLRDSIFIVGIKIPLKIGLLRHHRPPSLPRAKNKPESADDNFACKLVSGARGCSTCVYDFLFPCTNLGVCTWTL